MRRIGIVALGVGCALASCSGGDGVARIDAGPALRLSVTPTPDSVAIRPNESGLIVFRLTDGHNQPVPERVLRFLIVRTSATPPGEDSAKGAALSLDQGVTDENGEVLVQVIAGQATVFHVRAQAANATEGRAVVQVRTATHAPVDVVPTLEKDETTSVITTIRLNFFERATCAELAAMPDRQSDFPERTLAVDATTHYSAVAVDAPSAFAASALDDAGARVAAGCINLPSGSLQSKAVMLLTLPLRTLRPTPEGQFSVTSQLAFREPPRAGTTIAAAWTDLSDCPLDPAQLWLDCTIDALSGERVGDPNDCRPGADEGLVGARLIALRGTLIAPPGNTKCRHRLGDLGKPGIDALTSDLFPTPAPPQVVALAAIGRAASNLIDGLRLLSTMTFSATSLQNRFTVEHRLRTLEIRVETTVVPVDLVDLGLPLLLAHPVLAERSRSEIKLPAHSFTLRLGSATRYAFGKNALRARGLPTDALEFVSMLTNFATAIDSGNPLRGCAALDFVLCSQIEQARGCVAAACTAGLASLAAKLDEGFVSLDGDNLDFFIGGSGPLVDRNGDLMADAIGRVASSGALSGSWAGEVRARGGQSAVSGTWSAEKTSR